MLKVAVIGGGAAGLAAVSYLIREGPNVHVTLFEERTEFGGVWTNQSTQTQPNPMYDGLQTNVPHTLMTFTDHSWPKDTPLFPPHEQVRAYLRSYAEEKLLKSPQLTHHLGIRVVRLRKSSPAGWKISARGLFIRLADRFDKVVIAAGNYNDPFITEAEPGRQEWVRRGKLIMHSSEYKDAASFAGKVSLLSRTATRHHYPILTYSSEGTRCR